MKRVKIKVGNSTAPSIEYKADKRVYSAPKIVSEFINDEGVKCYKLDNGRTQSCESYNKLWCPQKEKVLPFNHREDLDSTHIH